MPLDLFLPKDSKGKSINVEASSDEEGGDSSSGKRGTKKASKKKERKKTKKKKRKGRGDDSSEEEEGEGSLDQDKSIEMNFISKNRLLLMNSALEEKLEELGLD